jgi:hypothetical protein
LIDLVQLAHLGVIAFRGNNAEQDETNELRAVESAK